MTRTTRPGAAAAPDRYRRDRIIAYRKGTDDGEVAAHFADVYGATVSKDVISRITEKVIGRTAGRKALSWAETA